MTRRVCLCILLLVMAPPIAVAAAGPDLSTPKSAAAALYQAVEEADASAILQMFWTQTDDQKVLASSMAHLIAAGRHLRAAALKRWGESARPLVEDMTAANELEQIRRAKIKQKGDRAELMLDDATRPIVFVRTDGQWRLDVTDYLAGGGEASLRNQARLLDRITAVLRTATEDIGNGKYVSAQAFGEDVTARLNRAMR